MLPDTLLTCHVYSQFISLYRQLLTEAVMDERRDSQDAGKYNFTLRMHTLVSWASTGARGKVMCWTPVGDYNFFCLCSEYAGYHSFHAESFKCPWPFFNFLIWIYTLPKELTRKKESRFTQNAIILSFWSLSNSPHFCPSLLLVLLGYKGTVT